jgi:hypothetical protein
MQEAVARVIIDVAMAEKSNTAEGDMPRVVAGSRRAGSLQVSLVVCGDPVVGRALALVLRGSRYDARFLPLYPPGESGSLEGVQLLLLGPAPRLSTRRREALLTLLKHEAAAAGVTVLELVPASEGETRDRPWRRVTWPCSVEQLKRRIEEALPPGPDETADLSSGA